MKNKKVVIKQPLMDHYIKATTPTRITNTIDDSCQGSNSVPAVVESSCRVIPINTFPAIQHGDVNRNKYEY